MMVERTKVDELREALEQRKTREERQPEPVPEPTMPEDERPQMMVEVSASADDRMAQLEEEVRCAQSEAAAHHERLLRTLAELENYRKRAEREKSEAITFANERLLKEFMVVLDHLDEALSHVPPQNECSDVLLAFVEGMSLTFRQCLTILQKYGFEEVPAEAGTVFDPSIHEAVSQVDTEDVKSGCIAMRQRRGYALHGRLLRAALVVVAK
ncbi:MAG: nucleotide exchange factor GrpE [Deltaproteobacteria bacterium]|nr:nucleotide exchange factor GrpE [Deltaproteobacteria bacterium]